MRSHLPNAFVRGHGLSAVCLATLALTATAGCSRDEAPSQAPAIAEASGALSTYLGGKTYLEVDRRPDTACTGGAPDGNCDRDETGATCPSDCEKAADANLVVGTDTDGTASVQRPPCAGGTCTWVDWTDLDPAEHQILDTYTDKDPSAFPQPDACVAPANNPPKQELTYAGVANNLDYGYFAVKRDTGNGDSAYFWLINQTAPTFTAGPVSYTDLSGSAKSCASGQQLLRFDITPGDFLLVGEFEPSSGATILRAFRAKVTKAGLDARSAVDFPALTAAGLFEELPQGEVFAAVNTTPTSAGKWGHPTGTYGAALFAEAAVPMATLTGNGEVCGRSFFASVMSKPSTSPASDLKDLIAPYAVHLADVIPTPTFKPGCDGNATYAVTATGPSGAPIAADAMTCSWTFKSDTGSTVQTTSCSGTVRLGAGTYTASVTVKDLESKCSSPQGTGNAGPITIQAPRAPDACESVTCDPATGAYTSTPTAAGTQCRSARGVCDAIEVCDGVNAACPADVKKTSECRASAGVCDVAERCDGVHDTCPADGFVTAGTECRGSNGVCDVPETCTGASAACPADGFAAAGKECRGSGGACDVPETCTGSGAACPTDGFVAAGTECRGAAGACDAPEACTGAGAACPADVKKTTECRGSSGVCDVPERCDGVGNDCPADGFVAAGTECRASNGVCDVPEACTGAGAACPADGFATAGTECRGAAGACDAPEACTGDGASCPADVKLTTECRASSGVCDVPESCDGVGNDCPADGVASAGTECRGADGACDVPESCDGEHTECPADELAPAGTVCGEGTGACHLADVCDGFVADCPQTTHEGDVCRPSEGACDPEELCDAVTGQCPADVRGICGHKFFDADTDGAWSEDEPPIEGWLVEATATAADGSEVAVQASTDAGGFYMIVPPSADPATYTVCEGVSSTASWIQTTPAEVCFQVDYPAADPNALYDFGNVCIGAGGGHTLGFWSNRNGERLFMGADAGASTLAMLRALNLRNADGSAFDPTSYSAFRTWILSATATNMAYMLSAQMAADALNTTVGYADGASLVYAPGADGANASGFMSLSDLVAEADAELALHAFTSADGVDADARPYQAALEKALDEANNDRSFVQDGICAFAFAGE